MNSYLKELAEDVLYHFGLSTKTTNFQGVFGDVKFVCTGGSRVRMKHFAEELSKAAGISKEISNLAGNDARFALFKVDSVLIADHGMGVPSLSIMLHEITKLLFYAGCKDVTFIRIGTSGGIGVKPGSVVISSGCVNTKFKPEYDLCILGQTVKRPTKLDLSVVEGLKNAALSLSLENPVVVGKTMCANDFYEEQARMDGSICGYTNEQKLAYLQSAYENGIRNFEMESTCLSAHCNVFGFKAGIICVTLVNRLESDQVNLSHEKYGHYQSLPAKVVIEYLKQHDGVKSRPIAS